MLMYENIKELLTILSVKRRVRFNFFLKHFEKRN